MVKLIVQNYKIIDKTETKVLRNTIRECKNIYQVWSSLSKEGQEQTKDLLDKEIDKKLAKCFKYYAKKYSVEIETGYGEMNDIEINISNICETVRSWE